MADETVNVKIKFNANTRELKQAAAELSLLQKRVKSLSSGREQAFAQRMGRDAASMSKQWKRSFDFIDSGAKMLGKTLTKFLALSIKGVIIEMAALGATMVATHALFAAGNLIMKAYRGTMQVLAGGAAGVAMGLAAVSAAIREQQAAIFAYRGKGAPAFGSAMNQTRMAMRNLQADASLAVLGVEALNKAYGNMSKSMNVTQINQSTGAIRALMDFGAAGQDPAKGLEQVSIVIAALSDKKKNISDVITEAKKLGPEMEQALKKANVKTKKQFQELLMSGQLAEKGGVAGQFDVINNTLIGQLKSYFTRLRTEFADFGDQFLEPLKIAFENVFNVIRRDLQRVMGSIMFSMGNDGLIGGLESALTNTSDWLVRMIREYLPKAIGLFDRIGDWFNSFKRGWNLILDQTRPLIDGARILYKAWDPIWEAIKRGATNLTLFRELLIENKDDMVEFGERIAGLIDVLSSFFQGLKRMFADMAPFINDLIAGVTGVVSMLTKTLTMFSGGGFASAFAPLLAFAVGARQLSQVKGRLMPNVGTMPFNTQQMQVQAGAVYVGGQPVGGTAGAITRRGGGPLSSGSVATHGIGAAGAAEALASGKTTGGNAKPASAGGSLASGRTTAAGGIPRYASGADFRKETRNTPGSRFFRSIFGGARASMQRSDVERRKLERFDKNREIGRGLSYYMFGKPGGTPFPGSEPGSPGARANAEAHAYAVLSGMPINRLTEEVYRQGGTVTDRTSRQEMIAKIRRGPTYYPEAYSGMSPRPTLGEALRNSRQRITLRAVQGLDATQRGISRTIGGMRGGFAALNSPAFDFEKGEYFKLEEARAAIEERRQQRVEGLQGKGAGLARTRARIAAMRENNRLNRNYGRFGYAYNQRFAKSLGGRMGAGMGLGLLSQVAPEEMRGSMALGATLAQIDPRLGIGVAGIGGALTARGAGKGAISGMAGGAAIGAMLGPQAAAIGAVLGGFFGAIRGAVNKGAYELKQAKEAVHQSLGKFYMDTIKASGEEFERNRQVLERGGSLADRRGVFQGLGGRLAATDIAFRGDLMRAIEAGKLAGNRGVVNNKLSAGSVEAGDILEEFFKTRTGSTISEEQRKAMRKKGLGSINEYLKATSPETQKQLLEIDKVNNKRLEALSKATNKSAAELDQMAKSLGIDLYDATIKYEDLLQKFTANLKKNSTQLNDALSDTFLAGADPFVQKRKRAEAANALDQSFRKASDILRGAGTRAEKQAAADTAMEQYFSQQLALAGGDASLAYKAYLQTFGQGPAGGAFAPGQQLAGQYGYFSTPTMTESGRRVEKGFASETATQIRAILAERNMQVDAGLLEQSIMNMTAAQQTALIDQLAVMASGSRQTREGQYNPLEVALAGTSAKAVQDSLAKMGFGGIGITQTDTQALNTIADAATDFSKAAEGLKEAIGKFNTQTKNFFTAPLDEMPAWWSRGLKVETTDEGTRLVPGDTMTPRAMRVGDTRSSKLSQTMARHSAMNSQLTGSRTVTSSLRNYALGSINSDHATGAAYDLVGQNLGQYAQLVRATGGFAEFHGVMANRHLHVVPGPGIGDTATPAPRMTSSVGGGAPITNYYTFEINGGNSSPEEIANMVMMKIDARDRSVRERR